MDFLPLLQTISLIFVSIFVYLPLSIYATIKSLFNSKKIKPKFIVITGATSGIGEALALSYAKEGITLGLTGRNKDALEDVASKCKSKGSKIFTLQSDVIDAEKLKNWLLEIDEKGNGIDLIYANAGISEQTNNVVSSIEKAARSLFSVNVDGVFNTIFPIIDKMKERQKGQVVIMASLASYGSISGAQAYSATKSAIRVYGEGLRWVLARDNIGVTVICPGYVISPMTKANKFPMPGLCTMEYAIDKIRKGVERNDPVVNFPHSTMIMMWLLGSMPIGVRDLISKAGVLPMIKYFPKRRQGIDKSK